MTEFYRLLATFIGEPNVKFYLHYIWYLDRYQLLFIKVVFKSGIIYLSKREFEFMLAMHLVNPHYRLEEVVKDILYITQAYSLAPDAVVWLLYNAGDISELNQDEIYKKRQEFTRFFASPPRIENLRGHTLPLFETAKLSYNH